MTKLINPQFDGFLTYLNNVGDDCPKTATPDILDRLIDSDYTRQLLKRYREGGDERAKMQLPAVLFNGLYVPSLAEQHMAQPTAPGEKKRSRRDIKTIKEHSGQLRLCPFIAAFAVALQELTRVVGINKSVKNVGSCRLGAVIPHIVQVG